MVRKAQTHLQLARHLALVRHAHGNGLEEHVVREAVVRERGRRRRGEREDGLVFERLRKVRGGGATSADARAR